MKLPTDIVSLYPIIADLRVHKTDLELDVLRYASKIANHAHMHIMKQIRPGMYEYQLERFGKFYGLS
jgi:Xaa-Pro dipeptidase